LSDTILVVEGGTAVAWTEPVDVAYDPNGPLPSLGAGFSKWATFLSMNTRRRTGFVAAFADGKARFIPDEADETIVRGLMTRDGGEKTDWAGLE
jgi:hypothetical protein